MHKKLYIPGPVEMSQDTIQSMAKPMIGHRMKEFDALYASIQGKLKKVLYTENPVFIFTSSATGVMEGTLRNLCAKRILSCINGAFSERWHKIALDCGLPADDLSVEWGQAITPELLDAKLKSGDYDLVTVCLNETSTGIMNPVKELAAVVKKYPGVLIAVDAVSAMTGVKIEVDAWGLDVCLASTQKAFGLPPGLAVCSVSQAALDRCTTVKGRGYYFDFIEMKKYHDKNQTPATPAVSLMYGLDFQLDKMLNEGLDNRFARHKEMSDFTKAWAKKNFALFGDEKHQSITLTTIENTKGISISDLNKELGNRGYHLSNGYGAKLKEKTFRIAHMADFTVADVKELLDQINDILGTTY